MKKTLLGFILLVPLPVLVLTGMEQALQTIVSMLIVFYAARFISDESPGTARGDSIRLLILTPLVTGVRFEGMFLIVAIAAFLVMRKRWAYALALGALGYLPWLVYGIISVTIPIGACWHFSTWACNSPWCCLTGELRC